jgi:hypothetical protein
VTAGLWSARRLLLTLVPAMRLVDAPVPARER